MKHWKGVLAWILAPFFVVGGTIIALIVGLLMVESTAEALIGIGVLLLAFLNWLDGDR